MPNGGMRLLLTGAMCISLAACAPEPGHVSNDAMLWPFDTVWTPGLRHPKQPHILSAENAGSWRPDPGYQFDDDSLNVSWKPGLGHRDHPNIRSAALEGAWEPLPGYDMASNLTATWSPGKRRPDHPHIYAAETERQWRPDLGYSFDSDGSLAVSWSPGTAHPDQAHVYAFTEEGYWMAVPGYLFDGGYEVVPTAQVSAAVWTGAVEHPACPLLISRSDSEGYWRQASGYEVLNTDPENIVLRRRAADPDETVGKVILAVVVGGIAHWLSQPGEDDGLAQQAGRFLAGEVRNEAAKGLLQTIANAGPGAEIRCSLLSTDWTRDLRFLRPTPE